MKRISVIIILCLMAHLAACVQSGEAAKVTQVAPEPAPEPIHEIPHKIAAVLYHGDSNWLNPLVSRHGEDNALTFCIDWASRDDIFIASFGRDIAHGADLILLFEETAAASTFPASAQAMDADTLVFFYDSMTWDDTPFVESAQHGSNVVFFGLDNERGMWW